LIIGLRKNFKEKNSMKIKHIFHPLFIFVLFLSAGNGIAQDGQNKTQKMNGEEMAQMMKSPHHKMMTAYRHNLLTFAGALRDLAKDPESFDQEYAKAMADEIKRSSEMMDKVHTDHMNKMDSVMKEKMASRMDKMKKHKTELDRRIKELEETLESDPIDQNAVGNHSSAIIEMLSAKKMDKNHKMKHKGKMKNM
jgi:hypothetical protein